MFFILKRRHQSSENNRLQKQTGNWNDDGNEEPRNFFTE